MIYLFTLSNALDKSDKVNTVPFLLSMARRVSSESLAKVLFQRMALGREPD